MAPVARGIARAHDLDVIHRDLKPENIFLVQLEGKAASS
jgi:serine/threonine protein kinase